MHEELVPSMPWGSGGWEKINVTPDQVFAMIDGYANQLRAQGARRIVVGGQSLGANVALALSRGAPERRRRASWPHPAIRRAVPTGTIPSIKEAIDRAAQLVQCGQASQPFSGPRRQRGQQHQDFHEGRRLRRLAQSARPGEHAGPGAAPARQHSRDADHRHQGPELQLYRGQHLQARRQESVQQVPGRSTAATIARPSRRHPNASSTGSKGLP